MVGLEPEKLSMQHKTLNGLGRRNKKVNECGHIEIIAIGISTVHSVLKNWHL